MAIYRLNASDTVTSSDQVPIYSQNAGDDRRVSIGKLLEYIFNIISTGSGTFTTQYASPSSTDFNVNVNEGSNVHLILTPIAGGYDGTIILPVYTSLTDKQEILVNTTQQVTNLAINKNGANAIHGIPSALGADDFFKLKYDLPNLVWYRIG